MKLKLTPIVLSFALLFQTQTVLAQPVFDAAKNAADTAYYSAQAIYDAAILKLKADIADFQTMAGISAKNTIEESAQQSADIRATNKVQNETIANTQTMGETCGSRSISAGSTAGQAQTAKAAAVMSNFHVKRGNLMPSENNQITQAAAQQVGKYADPTDPVALAVNNGKPPTPKPMDVGGTWEGKNLQASSLLSGAGNDVVATKGTRLSFSRDQMEAAIDFKNRIADGTAQPQALSPSQAVTPDGIAYETKRADYTARRSIALSVLDAEVEGKRPVAELYKTLDAIKTTPVQTQYISKVVTDALTQVTDKIVDANGKKGISSDDFLRVDYTRRADSPEWGMMLGEMKSDVPLLKEIAAMNASSLKMQYMIYRQQQTGLLMQAQTVLEQIDASSLAKLKQMRAVAAANR